MDVEQRDGSGTGGRRDDDRESAELGRRDVTPHYGPFFAEADEHERFLCSASSVVRPLFDSAGTGDRLTVVENRAMQPYASPLHIHHVLTSLELV